MGLSISRTIVEAHGGRLWAENNAERRGAFRFTVPVAETPTTPLLPTITTTCLNPPHLTPLQQHRSGGEHDRTHRPPRRRRRVLPAGDRAAAAASGFSVRPTRPRPSFLAQCEEDAPGCVVADLRMPGWAGSTCRRHWPARHPLPLLFLTGQGDIASTVRAMRGGAEDFLEKRAPREQLLDAVQRALARDAASAGAPRQDLLRGASGRSPCASAKCSTRWCRAG